MSKVIKYDSFKRGDTPVFAFDFTAPSLTFDWSAVTLDAAITSVSAPSTNAGAAVLRQAQALTVATDNSASYELQPTVTESNALIPETTYKVEVQLKELSGAHVTTPITGQVTIEQDYII